jgi:succinate-semialdehyde dehydrogenase/glutarate-semialdehyde dehydrogenase
MKTLPVINPRTGQADYEIPDHDESHVAQQASQIRSAQPEWQKAGMTWRCDILRKWRKSLEHHAADITAALTIDTGRRLISSIEIRSIIEMIDYWVKRAPQIVQSQKKGKSSMAPSVHYRHELVPYPLVGVISPWNVPLILAMIDAMPALLSGSAVLLKPSEITPRFAKPLAASIRDVPELEAVFRIVTGGPDTGKALINHSDIVCFTGSVATGRKVASHAAQNFIPAFLELGGKDPAIVLASADLDNAATAILRSAAGLSGQACQSLERIYVDQSVFEPFLEKLVEKAQTISANWPDPGKGQMGPFIFQPQAEKVRQQIEQAVAAGAKIHSGGEVLNQDGGFWCLPTVMTDVDHSMLVFQEETFGPLLPLMPFNTVDEAIELANDSDFGLSAAVFASSREEGESVAQQIKAGAVSINDASLTATVQDVEKNAFCLSGMGGSRMGDSGLMRFYRKQALFFQTAPAMPLQVLDESVSEPQAGAGK